jgi:competence protein ComEA
VLAWLERNQLAVLGAALVLFAATLALGTLNDDERAPLQFRNDSTLAPGTPIRVHVAGAVVAPGVYEMREGDRLIDALTAAGGPSALADLDALNLARRVRDEEQVLVPAREPERASASLPLVLAPGARIDINTATAAQLDQLPGIGEAYSRRIIDSRAVDGPFASTEDLVSRRVLPRATYDRIRDLISVGP